MNTHESGSVIRVEFTERLTAKEYTAMVFGCWAVLVAGGHAEAAVVVPDGSATDQQLEDVLETLIGCSNWGW
jgi:hypothetical protein